MLELQKSNNRKCNGGGGKLLIALALLIVLAVPLWAQDGYVSLGTNAEGTWSFHRPSVEERNDDYGTRCIAGWVQVIYSDAGARRISYQYIPYRGMFLYAARKDLKQIKTMSETYYNKEGLEIDSYPWARQWKECPPGSMNEKIWNALMQAAGIRY